MLDSTAGGVVSRPLLNPASCANTAAATSGAGLWVDTQDLEGYAVFQLHVGAVTGTIAGKLQTATDANGTGAADVTGGAFPASVANTEVTLTLPVHGFAARYVGFVGTIVTGPVLVGVNMIAGKKYA